MQDILEEKSICLEKLYKYIRIINTIHHISELHQPLLFYAIKIYLKQCQLSRDSLTQFKLKQKKMGWALFNLCYAVLPGDYKNHANQVHVAEWVSWIFINYNF